MNILAIETSCDETAVAIIHADNGRFAVRASIISSQVELHRTYGGVVPNLAGREHTKNMMPVLTEALATAHTTPNDIDLIAVTAGPGLIPALLVGVTTAKTLAYGWRKPLLGLHHIEGHIYANWLPHDGHPMSNRTSDVPSMPTFPALALVVSGGHTQLVLMRDHCQYEIIGQTHDDAVGEAFDKAARLLGLSYPGGPEIAAKAERYDATSNPFTITLPRPMITSGDYNFSFSGIKTAVLYAVRAFQKEHDLNTDDPLPKDFVIAVAHEFQEAVTEVLITKTLKAAAEYDVQSVLLAGGVSANVHLRKHLGAALAESLPHNTYHVPHMAHCLDNAAMIAAAAAYRWEHMSADHKVDASNGWHSVRANPHLTMSSL